jgi:hypothetical protein
VRFQVLTEASMKITASIIRVMRLNALMMEAVRTSETSVYFNETTRRCFILAAVRT